MAPGDATTHAPAVSSVGTQLRLDPTNRDEQNLSLVDTQSGVDRLNAAFYGQYPYPSRALGLERPLDPDLQRAMLCQDVGDWRHEAIPQQPAIWIGGCGTNQGLITALSFPRARVVASDVSAPSLDVAARGARDLSIANIELRCESLNDVAYEDQFDYVVCTGVIMVNADPAVPLERLARALKPGGVLELMVYSRLQRIPSSSAQKAVRILAGTGVPGDDRERDVARALVNEFEAPGSMGVFLRRLRFARLSEFADGILQPVEQSYTVASLDALARRCGLEMLQPVVSVYNKLRSNFTWDLTLPTPVLEQAYLRCDDVQRWQVANLLLGEDSPLLWFYFRRAGAAPPPTTREICDAFLATPFSKVATRRQAYALGADDHYRLVPGSIKFPPAIDGPLRAVVDAADGRTPMRDILGRCGIPTTFPHVNDVRSRLTTTAFPYLKAVAS